MQQRFNFLSSQKSSEVFTEQLVGELYPAAPPAQRRAFLFLHGFPFGSPNEDAAQALARRGYASMTYFMAGNEPSGGDIETVTIERSLRDAEKAYDALRDHVGKTALIGVVASSFGAYIATRLTGSRTVDCLALRVPANYPNDLAELPLKPILDDPGQNDELRVWRGQAAGLNPGDNFALDALRDFRGSVQIIRALRDEVIPTATVEAYAGAVTPGVNLDYTTVDMFHGLRTDAQAAAYVNLLTGWVDRLPQG